MEGFIPKATHARENRTALTPDSAAKLIQLGFKLSAESGLGDKSGYPDSQYEEKGVTLTPDDSGISQADVVIGDRR